MWDELKRMKREHRNRAIVGNLKCAAAIASFIFGLYQLDDAMDERLHLFMFGVMPWLVIPLLWVAFEIGKIAGADKEQERNRRYAEALKEATKKDT